VDAKHCNRGSPPPKRIYDDYCRQRFRCDIKAEYKRLVGEKERLQALCDKLQFDVERREKRVLNVELIRRSLADFAELVGLLPLEDQKELFQLLVREIEVWPFDPANEQPPTEKGEFTTKIRARSYRVRISLYQLPSAALINRDTNSSDNRPSGSASHGRGSRTRPPSATVSFVGRRCTTAGGRWASSANRTTL